MRWEALLHGFAPKLYGCMAQGATPEAALTNSNAARADYVAALLDAGLEIMLPTAVVAGTPRS